MTVVTSNTIQPASGQALTIKDEGGTASITVATNGEATFAENIKITNGKGIDFSNATDVATGETVTSSILDDYEEGTYTPVITRASSNPTGTPAVSGHYTKIGNLVYVQVYAQLNGFSGGSGNWRCSLPFTSSTKTHQIELNKGRIYMDGDSADRQFRVQENTAYVELWVPSNDTRYTSNASYLIWYFNGFFSVA